MLTKCEAYMSILKFFKPVNSLPTAKQTGLLEHAVCSANYAIERMLEKEKCQQGEDLSSGHKHKYTMTFTADYRWQVCCREWSCKSTETRQAIES